jgi:outer membrane protein assembly factor BamE (lipoprotein component of BamABCDE complex)
MVRSTSHIKQLVVIASLVASSSSIFSIANAEQVKIPLGQQQQITQQSSLKMPTTGMTKNRVAATFGEPQETTPAKGNPPISSWKYSDFVVYFENDHVIHSVAKFKPQAQTEQIINLDE